jgi:hypothetical protein
MPARLRDLRRALAHFGVTVSPGGKHFKAERDPDPSYPIPASNGDKTEIGDEYIRGLCRNFEIELAELKKRL